MKKVLRVILALVLMTSMISIISVTAYAATGEFLITINVTSDNADVAEVDVTVTSPEKPDSTPESTEYQDVTNPESDNYDYPESTEHSEKRPQANEGDSVSVSFDVKEGYTTEVRGQYCPEDNPLVPPSSLEGYSFDGAVYSFTMPNGSVFFDVKYNKKSLPPQKPKENNNSNIETPKKYNEESEPATIPATTGNVANNSVLPANTVLFGATTGDTYNNKYSATVLNLEARDLSNQNGLAAYYATLEGKEADILASYSIIASKDLSNEDNGKLTSLTWKYIDSIFGHTIDKNTKIKAVCYNIVDGTYVIEGEIDEFGNIVLKNFILRPTKTNITVFVCR